MLRPILRVILAIAFMAALPACLLVRVVERSSLTVENGTIPPEFGEAGQVLLVVLMGNNESVDEHTQEGFEAYRGPHRVVRRNELFSPEFADMSKYRFAFSHMGVNTVVVGYRQQSPGAVPRLHPGYEPIDARTSQFALTDRRDNRVYPGPSSSMFRAIIDAYVDRLNEIFAGTIQRPA